jgi:hypothetical protein
MNLVKTQFKSTFALACLKELKQKQDDLLDDLNASMALEQFIPNVFENGGVKVKVRSKDNKYTITINDKEYASNELPLVYWKHLKSKLVIKNK